MQIMHIYAKTIAIIFLYKIAGIYEWERNM